MAWVTGLLRRSSRGEVVVIVLRIKLHRRVFGRHTEGNGVVYARSADVNSVEGQLLE